MNRIKSTFFMAAIALSVMSISAQVHKDTTTTKTKLRDSLDSLSYVIGRDVGAQLKDLGANLNMSPFTMGVEHSLKGVKSIIDSSKADSIRRAFAAQVQQKIAKEQANIAQQNKLKNDNFFALNKKKQGVVTTSSGLQYKVIKKGTGPKPKASDSVSVLYKGMLLDSTTFDSTVDNQPMVLSLQRTIPGLVEGIQLMPVGSKYRFFIPPELAYGSQGAPPRIPPNAALIFDIELVGIAGQQAKK